MNEKKCSCNEKKRVEHSTIRVVVASIALFFGSVTAAIAGGETVSFTVGAGSEYRELPALASYMSPLSSGKTGAASITGPAGAVDFRVPYLSGSAGDGVRMRVSAAALCGHGRIWIPGAGGTESGSSSNTSTSGASGGSTYNSKTDWQNTYTDELTQISYCDRRAAVDLAFRGRGESGIVLTPRVGIGTSKRRFGSLKSASERTEIVSVSSSTSSSGGGEGSGTVDGGRESHALVDAVKVNTTFLRAGVEIEKKVTERGSLTGGIGVEIPTSLPTARYEYEQFQSLTTASSSSSGGGKNNSESRNTTVSGGTETYSPWTRSGAVATAQLGYSYRGLGAEIYYRKEIGASANDAYGVQVGFTF